MTVEAWLRRGALPAVLAAATVAAGCGGETIDVSKGVESINKTLTGQHVHLTCPKTVNGGAGKVFTCTLANTRNHQSTKLRLKVIKQKGQLTVVPVSNKEASKALQRIGAA